jgi:BASS family bile acid:Na+ symporter
MPDLQGLIKLALSASILLLVLGLGMRATFADATSFFSHLFHSPYSLARAVFTMNFVVPMVAALSAKVFALPLPVNVAMVALSISPVPPILPGKQIKFGGSEKFVYGLLVAVSLAAILLVPLSVELLGSLFHRDVHMSFATMAQLMAKTILVPLVVGMAIQYYVPDLAARIGHWVLRVGNLLLVIAVLPVLISSLSGMWSLIGDGTILVFLLVISVAILAGQWIGGPDEHDRTALAIVSPLRHPGVALAIGTINFPNEKLVPAAVLLYFLLAVILTTIYGKLRLRNLSGRRASAMPAHAP